jgi:hypothetical protein
MIRGHRAHVENRGCHTREGRPGPWGPGHHTHVEVLRTRTRSWPVRAPPRPGPTSNPRRDSRLVEPESVSDRRPSHPGGVLEDVHVLLEAHLAPARPVRVVDHAAQLLVGDLHLEPGHGGLQHLRWARIGVKDVPKFACTVASSTHFQAPRRSNTDVGHHGRVPMGPNGRLASKPCEIQGARLQVTALLKNQGESKVSLSLSLSLYIYIYIYNYIISARLQVTALLKNQIAWAKRITIFRITWKQRTWKQRTWRAASVSTASPAPSHARPSVSKSLHRRVIEMPAAAISLAYRALPPHFSHCPSRLQHLQVDPRRRLVLPAHEREGGADLLLRVAPGELRAHELRELL